MKSDLGNDIAAETKSDRPHYLQPTYLRHNLVVGINALTEGCKLTFTPVDELLHPLGELENARGESHYDWSKTTGYLLKAERIAEPKNQPIDSVKLKKVWLEAMRTMGIDPAITPGISHDSVQRVGDGIWINNSALDAIQKKWHEPYRLSEKEAARVWSTEPSEREFVTLATARIQGFVSSLRKGLGAEQTLAL